VLERKPAPPRPPKLDGEAEAQLVTLCCSQAPEGRQRWTLQLLCDELARLQVVESVCPETVRQCLKKTNFSLGGPSGSAFRRRTGPDSSRRWKRSSTPTRNRTTRRTC
jgi:transposase